MAENRFTAACRSLKQVFSDPAKQTYYPERPQKGRFQIWCEQLKWILKYREINHYYFFYGCDLLDGHDPFEYVCKKDFIRRRDRINASGHLGDRVANYNCILQDKFLFSQYLKSMNYPTPEVYGLGDRETIYWLSTKETLTWEAFAEQHKGSYFSKDILGQRGEQVFFFENTPDGLRLDGKTVSVEGFKSQIGAKNILQERIEQHELLNAMNPASVNTMRIVTALNGDRVVPLSAMLRLGVANGSRDNLSAGGIAVGLDIQTGLLSDHGFYKPGFGGRTTAHPDTGFEFKGVHFPLFKEAKEIVCRLHEMFYGVHSIGWDVAMTPEGPTILEGNNAWEIPTLQVFDKALIDKYNKTLVGAAT